ncbi:MAG TPA: hypothetical protein VGG71_03135 [Chitinophagaceae bacterium]|jgi:hypothetical protein
MDKFLGFFNKISGLLVFLILVLLAVNHFHHHHSHRMGGHGHQGRDSVKTYTDSTGRK